MSRNLRIFVAGLCLLATAYKIQAADSKLLQCWHCSSETIGSEDFCGVTFKEDNIPAEHLKTRNISILRSCNSTINSELERPVCRKTVEDINGKTVTKRFCYYTNKSEKVDKCNEQSTENNVKRLYCGDCLEDRCNSAPGLTAMAKVLATVLALPLAVAKVLRA